MLEESSSVELPTDILAGVLQHLGEKERLQSGALVCKKWQLAANLATCRVLGATDSEQSVQSLSAWLNSNNYVGSLQSIQVTTCGRHLKHPPFLQLPADKLTGLRTLQLSNCFLDMSCTDAAVPAADAATFIAVVRATQPRSLTALTALRRLQLDRTVLDVSALGSCTRLQHLELTWVRPVTVPDPATAAEAVTAVVDRSQWCRGSLAGQLASAVPNLTQLTYLSVMPDAYAVIDHLSALQNLQELKLGHVLAEHLVDLPISLTALQLWLHNYQDSDHVPRSLPHLLQLTRLQRLHLVDGRESVPVLLLSVTQLTYLVLEDDEVTEEAAVEDLMAALQQLKHLQHLGLAHCLLEVINEEFPDPEVYAALTASSHLTFLDIRNSCFPEEANNHMFAAAGALRNLKVLLAGPMLFSEPGDFERLGACCPALEELELHYEDWRAPYTDWRSEAADVDVEVSMLSQKARISKEQWWVKAVCGWHCLTPRLCSSRSLEVPSGQCMADCQSFGAVIAAVLCHI